MPSAELVTKQVKPHIGSRVLNDKKDLLSGKFASEIPSRYVLPKLLPSLSPIDIFLHDADHTYHSQLEEYRLAWPHLRAGGVLISDDVGNPAFTEFASEQGQTPLLVAQTDKEYPFGLIRKP